MTISADFAVQVLDNLSTAVMLFDKDLRLTCINSAAEDLLSVSHRRVIGRGTDMIIVPPSLLNEMIDRCFKTGHPYTERGLEVQLLNDHHITVDCKVTPMMPEEGCNQVIVELVDGDTLQKVMREENLTLLHDAARESVRGMAHEVKNPLGGIRGAAQLLEHELDNGHGELKEYTRIIINESDRLRNFIDRMLTSERKISLQTVNIHELLEYVCSVVEAEHNEALDIERDYDPSLPDMQLDREQVIQAVLNVVQNAIQAAGLRGHVCLRTRIQRQFTIHKRVHRLAVQIDVIDDGPGIPPELENGIFYPMITGRPEGTGLGLSIAQSIINLHGGLIQYERTDEKTIFSIFLPTGQESG